MADEKPNPYYRPGAPIIRNYTPEDYGTETQNWCVIQDDQGLIYVGNAMGVLVFDGVYWRYIETPRQTRVRALAMGDDGVVYVGTSGDIGFLASDSIGNLSYRSLMNKFKTPPEKFGDIWSVNVTSHGIYFISGYAIFRFHEGKIQTIPTERLGVGYTIGDDVWYGIANGGISIIRNGNVISLDHTKHMSRESAGFYSISPYNADHVLIATTKLGCFLHKIPPQNDQPPQAADLIPFPTEAAEYFRKANIYRVAPIPDSDNFVFATLKGGVAIMDAQGRLIKTITEADGLISNTITGTLFDRDGNLWATSVIGLSHLMTSSPWTRFDVSGEVKSNMISLASYGDRLYVGFLDGVSYLAEHRGGKPLDAPVAYPVKNADIQCFDMLVHNNMLLAGIHNGLYEIQGDQAHKLIEIPDIPYIVSLGWSRRFPNHVFVGSEMTGIYAVEILGEGEDRRATAIPLNQPSFAKDTYFRIVEDNNGDLWTTSDEGEIAHFKFKGDDVKSIEMIRFGVQQGLPAKDLNTVYWIDGQVMAATQKGIYRYVPESHSDESKSPGRFVPFSELPYENKVVHEVFDYGDDLLLDTPEGLLRWSRRSDGTYAPAAPDFRLIPATTRDFKRWEFEPNGIVWVARNEFIFRYDPNIKKDFNKPYQSYVRSVEDKKNRKIFMGTFVDPAAAVPELSYDENALTFQYAAPFFEYHEKLLFSYKLLGFDQTWSPWEKSAEKEYTNLPEGTYAFRVKAKNIYGQESKPAEYRFIIHPPWYRTVYAYIGYVVGFLLVLYSGISWNTRRLRASKANLEKVVKERTKEIEAQKVQLEVAYTEVNKTKDALWGEMQLAQKIQTVLLPDAPQIPGYDITAYMQTADEVGGDYYDVIQIDGRYWLVIGDVSGHGVPAGLVMMMVQTAIHMAIEDNAHATPAQILNKVNRVIYENIQKLDGTKYMTMTILSVQENGEFLYSGLHQDILMYRANTRLVDSVETDGMWLGITADIEEMLTTERISLNKGDVMLLFTDGITEATDAAGNMLSTEYLHQILKESGAGTVKEIEAKILKALEPYTWDDDITFMVIKRDGVTQTDPPLN